MIGLLLGAGVYGAAHYLKFADMKQSLVSGQSKLERLEQKIQEGRAAQRELPKFREEVRQLELRLERLLRILPARRNTPDLLRRIRNITEQGDLDFVSINPGNFQDEDFYSIWPIKMNLRGNYHSLAMFFDRIGRFSRIINISNLVVRPNSTGRNTVGANFTASTFVYKEESEDEEALE